MHSSAPHEYDRFVAEDSHLTAQFDTFETDTFAQDWTGVNNILVPPFALVGQVLQHLQEHGGFGTLILPKWEAKWYWPLLVKMQTSEFLEIGNWAFRAGPSGSAEPWKGPWTMVAVQLRAPTMLGGALPETEAELAAMRWAKSTTSGYERVFGKLQGLAKTAQTPLNLWTVDRVIDVLIHWREYAPTEIHTVVTILNHTFDGLGIPSPARGKRVLDLLVGAVRKDALTKTHRILQPEFEVAWLRAFVRSTGCWTFYKNRDTAIVAVGFRLARRPSDLAVVDWEHICFEA